MWNNYIDCFNSIFFKDKNIIIAPAIKDIIFNNIKIFQSERTNKIDNKHPAAIGNIFLFMPYELLKASNKYVMNGIIKKYPIQSVIRHKTSIDTIRHTSMIVPNKRLNIKYLYFITTQC